LLCGSHRGGHAHQKAQDNEPSGKARVRITTKIEVFSHGYLA
jgi:hypothetical protein